MEMAKLYFEESKKLMVQHMEEIPQNQSNNNDSFNNRIGSAINFNNLSVIELR